MKKAWIIAFVVLIAMVAVITAFYLYTINHTQGPNNYSEKELAGENKKENSIDKNMIINTSSEEEKLSPHAQIVIQRKYQECGHIVKEKIDIEETMVNMKKEDFAKLYPDWEIEKFTKSQVMLLKQFEGSCNKHYVLKEKDGYIAIYTINSKGEETIKEMTEISTKYLPETDLISLRNGIKANGDEDLNKILENFE